MNNTLSETALPGQSTSFLDHFQHFQRSKVANQFFSAYRNGAHTLDALLKTVKDDARLRCVTEDLEALAVQQRLVSLLKTDEARTYAQHIINRESLLPSERQRLKAERSEKYKREYMKAQAPTERQLRYLRSLGSSVLPANRLEASEIIEGHVRG